MEKCSISDARMVGPPRLGRDDILIFSFSPGSLADIKD